MEQKLPLAVRIIGAVSPHPTVVGLKPSLSQSRLELWLSGRDRSPGHPGGGAGVPSQHPPRPKVPKIAQLSKRE